jgi:hypothetical protein
MASAAKKSYYAVYFFIFDVLTEKSAFTVIAHVLEAAN